MGTWIVRDRLDELAARSHRGYLWVRRRKNGLAIVEWAAKLKGTVLPEPVVNQLLEAIFTTGLAAAKTTLER